MTRSRLVLLFVAGWLLLNYPLLSLSDRPVLIAGIPLLYGYLLLVWLGLIVGIYVILENPGPNRPNS